MKNGIYFISVCYIPVNNISLAINNSIKSNLLNQYFIINNTFLQLTDDEVTRIYRERNPLERLAQLNSLKQRESSVVRDMILGRVGASSRASAASTRVAFGIRRPRNAVLASTVPLPPKESEFVIATIPSPPILNSVELQQNVCLKSQSCHHLEQLMDFPLIDADESEMLPVPPVRPARRNAKSPKRTEDPKVHLTSNEEEKQSSEMSQTNQNVNITNTETFSKCMNGKNEDETPKLSPVKKTVSLPATPLTDPEKFGIPIRNTTKHQNKNQASRKKLTLDTSLSSEDNKSLASPVDQISSTSNEIENMDGILSSGGDSVTNSPAKRSIGGSTSQTREPKRTLMQAITGMFARGSTPDSRSKSPDLKTSESERKSRSDSFMKFAKGFRSPNAPLKSTPSSPEAPRADISELSMSSQASFPNSPKHTNKDKQKPNEQDMIFKTISIQASHPSTPPFPLSRKITLKHAQSEESLSDDVDDSEGSPETSLAFVANNFKASEKMPNDGKMSKASLPPEILEKILRRGGKSAKRAARIAQLKRVRKAQEIQRQLEELDVKHKDLEERGVKAEQSLRGETSNYEEENVNEGDLMHTWFLLLTEKNALVRNEQELLVQAKQLELEDRSSRLEVELRDHLLRDSRSLDSVSREGEILDELLEISEQREMLESMLVKDKMRYQLEDKDIEAQMRAKGVRITPVRKINVNCSK